MVKRAMSEAESQLQYWVIRHSRKKTFEHGGNIIKRRESIVGKQIIDEDSPGSTEGIEVGSEALLPFLLAARVTTCAPKNRPVFAEGLASSYEAFLHTRLQNLQRDKDRSEASFVDIDDDTADADSTIESGGHQVSVGEWYLRQLESIVPRDDIQASLKHPKISKTIQRALAIWSTGEKVLVFCHYIATGWVLRQHISAEMTRSILSMDDAPSG